MVASTWENAGPSPTPRKLTGSSGGDGSGGGGIAVKSDMQGNSGTGAMSAPKSFQKGGGEEKKATGKAKEKKKAKQCKEPERDTVVVHLVVHGMANLPPARMQTLKMQLKASECHVR